MRYFDGGHQGKIFVLPFICAVLLAGTPAFPQNFWQQTSGPLGGDVRALAVKTSGDIFAGHNESGIYRSTDNGANWTVVNNGLTNGAVNALAINSSGDIFAGTFGGVFLSTNNGASWSAANTNLTNTRVRSLAIKSSGEIFAGTEGGVFISTDNAKTWTAVNSGLTNTFVQTLAINNNTGDIFAGTTTGVFISSNNGGAWRPFNTGFPTSLPTIRALAINSLGNIFAGTNNGIYRALGTTASWTAINSGLTNFFIPSIYVHSSGDIFAGSEGSGIFRSIDNGNNWTTANTGLGIMIVQAFARNTLGTIFVGTTGGMFRSVTGASLSWTEINTGMLTAKVSALAIKATDYIFAGTTAGRVFRSKDFGASWTLTSNGLPNDAVQSINALAISPTTGDIFAGTANDGIYRSSNDGTTWTRINLGLAESNILSLAINASGHIFAGGASDGIARSTDNGESWQEVNAGLAIAPIRALAINASGDLFAGVFLSGIFYSKDNGNNWTAASTGLPSRPPILSLTVNTNSDVYTGLSNGAVYRSTDNGANWTLANSGLPNSASNSLVTNAAGHVFDGTNLDGPYRTIDNGTKWSSINSGLTTNIIKSLAIRTDGFAFAGTGAAGVFRSVKSTAPPEVAFSTGTLNYGNVLLNTSADLTVTLTNTGFSDLSIAGASLAGTNANQFNLVSGGTGTIPPNTSQSITLRFTPTSVGNKSAFFILASNAASTPDTVTLAGTGVEPLVSFSNANLQYGNVLVNSDADLSVRLTNIGTADLSISNASLVGPNANQFSIVNIGNSGTLAPNAFLDITLRFSPTSAGNKIGYFVIASNAASTPDTVTLAGTGIAPLVSFDNANLQYGTVLVNAISDLTVRLTNTGTANLSINATSLAGANANQFSIVTGGAAGTLAPNAFRDITLRFAPTSTGNKFAYFVLTSNAASTPDTVTLTGSGITPLVSFSIDSLKYGNVLVNANADLTVRLTNTGTANLSINATSLAGTNANQFNIVTGGAAGTMAPNAFRDIALRFSPTSAGNKLAYFVLTSNAASTPDTVTLTGNGITPLVSFSDDSLKYGNVSVNANSDLTVRLTNTGTADLSINATSLAGTNANQFSIVTGGAAGTLAPNTFRDITLRFSPTSSGNKIAYFILTSNAASTPDTVTLTGTGITPLVSFSNDSLKYGNVSVNANSDLTVRLTNTGTANLSINATSLAGANANQFNIVTGGAAGTIAPNAFRDITLRFAPTSAGNKLAYFVLTSNAASTPDTVTLTGTGITPLVSFATDSLKFDNVSVNANSDLTVRLTNTGTADLSITATSLAGANANQFSIITGGAAGTLAPNAFRDITLRFSPTSAGNKLAYFVLTSNAASTPDTVALIGSGTASLVSFSKDSLKYGNVSLSANSDLTVRLNNSGTSDLTINNATLAGVNANQFSIVSGGAAGTLAPNAFRDIALRFAPTNAGSNIAYFILTSNAASSPDTVTLTGTGVGPLVSFSLDSLKYGAVPVSADSDLTVRLTNTGTADLSIRSTAMTGAAEFSIVNGGAAGTLAPNAFRDITLRFAPTSAGNKIAYFILTSNAASSPDTVALTGVGGAAILSLSSNNLQYGSLVINSSAEQTLRLTNTGTADLAISTTMLAGANTADFSIINGGGAGTLAPNAFRDVRLRFTPQSRGSKLALLVIASEAASSPDTVTLLGNGVDSASEQDSLTLVALFNSTGGANWKNNTNWLARPVASWFGVTVLNNAVTAVMLDSNNLVGPLPAEIGNLTKLAQLNLSANRLSGDVPNALTNLSALRELYLHNNRLVNLPNVTAIAALDTVFIHGNQLTFEDVEPNLAAKIDSISYTPQDSVGNTSDTTLFDGAKLTLRVEVGGNNNRYQWLKDGAPISGAIANTHTIGAATQADVGAYVCRITNTTATQLMLFSRPQRISAVIAPRFTFAPQTLNFGSVRVNASFDQTVTLTNPLNVDIAIRQTSIIATDAAHFNIVSGGGAQILPARSSRRITVRFIPKSRGSKFAALEIFSNLSANLDTVNLTGAGVEPLTTLSSANVNFGAIAVGANASQTVTLTNSGTADLAISFVDLAGVNAGGFSITAGGATGTLVPNASRNMALRFAPQSAGAKTALLVITTDAASSPDTVRLSGTANAPALSLSQRNVDFGNVWVGGTPVVQTVTVRNTGAANLNITNTSLIGANANAFVITSGGGAATILPSTSRDIILQFAPQSVGPKNAALIIASNAASIPDTVKLLGTGSELVVNVGNSGNPLVGTKVNLAVSALGGFVPTSRFLFYRIAGETKYDSIRIEPNGSNFTADIPPSAVTVRGVEFYVRFSDGSTVVTYPALNARNRPEMIRVRIDEHPFPLTLEPNTYKMISVGMDLDSTGFEHVLEEYAEYDTLFWRLFRWENNRYEEYSDINARFTPGAAFWLITRGGEGFGFNAALSTPSAQPFAMTLQPGWNQIANPFAFPVAVDSLRRTGRADTLAFWDGVEYQYNVTVLEPWEGYFIFNLESAPITLTIPPIAAAKKSGKSARTLAANEYVLQLSAQMIGTKLVDTQNFVGLLNRAQADRDALDFAEAPAIGDYVQLSIVDNAERFAGNFKPANGDGQQWTFEVRAHLSANVAKKLQIGLQETGPLPEGFQRFVLDQDYGAILPINNETFRVELNDKIAVRRFKIIVGTKAYAESNNDGIPLAPVDYVLEQNYPNPFALSAPAGAGNLPTTIRYQLSQRAPVVLEIRNTLGQRVRTLVNGEQSTGQHAATWDGLDEAGRAAASGVYFYTLKTAEFTATRKLVLTR